MSSQCQLFLYVTVIVPHIQTWGRHKSVDRRFAPGPSPVRVEKLLSEHLPPDESQDANAFILHFLSDSSLVSL